MVSHDPEAQRKVLQEIVEKMKEEANEGSDEGLRRHTEVHSMNEDESLEEEMLSWVISVRRFTKRSKNDKNTDIRNILLARVN